MSASVSLLGANDLTGARVVNGLVGAGALTVLILEGASASHMLDANDRPRVVGEVVTNGSGGVEVFPLGSSVGITALGLLAMPTTSILILDRLRGCGTGRVHYAADLQL